MISQGYLIDSLACTVGLWLLYLGLLHRRVNLSLARIYLLALFPVGLLLPLLEIPLLPAPAVAIPEAMTVADILPGLLAKLQETPEVSAPTLTFTQLLGWAYWTGMGIAGLFLLWGLARIGWRIRRSRTEQIGHTRVIFDPRVSGAYSLFGTVFVNDQYKGSPLLDLILTHERCHIAKGHTWDLLWMNLWRCLQWCNPIAWHTLKLLREVHEFQADQAVLCAGNPVSPYLELLLTTEVGFYPSTANTFSYSLTKKRLAMIQQQVNQSHHGTWKRLFSIIPVMALLMGAFCLTTRAAQSTEVTPVKTTTPASVTPTAQTAPVKTTTSAAKTAQTAPETSGAISVQSRAISPELIKLQTNTGGLVTDSITPIILVDGVVKTYSEYIAMTKNGLTPDEYKTVTILRGGAATALYGEKGKNGAIIVTTTFAQNGGGINAYIARDSTRGFSIDFTPTPVVSGGSFTLTADTIRTFSGSYRPLPPLFVLDGRIVRASDLERLNMNTIEHVTVLKGPAATSLYGPDGANGAIVITSRTVSVIYPDSQSDRKNSRKGTGVTVRAIGDVSVNSPESK